MSPTAPDVHAPTRLDILAARRRLRQWLSPTPLRECAWLSDRCGRSVLLKLESANPGNSFKIRGAFNALARLVERTSPHVAAPVVVTASAGNHGRAVALAAEHLGLKAVVFTPSTAPQAKRQAIRRHGATLHDSAPDYDSAEQEAHGFAERHGAVFISPYNHPDVIAGAGTVGLEILEECPSVGAIVAPLGGGGLASGVGLAVGAAAPPVPVIGAEAEASTPFTTGLALGTITHIEPRPTLADGLAGNLEPGSLTFPLVRQGVERVVTVSERAIADAIREMAEGERLFVEGAAAVAIAAAMSETDLAEPVVVLVTGSNIDLGTWLSVVRR